MSSIFLPLRSNAAWFASDDHRAALEYRLKNLATIYDVLVLQNGRYHRAASETGGFDWLMPPGTIEDRAKLRGMSAGQPFSVRVAETGTTDWHQVVGGLALVNYEVDFFPVFNDAGLANATYLDWRNIDITDTGKSEAKTLASADRRRPEVRAVLPQGRFVQDAIVDGLYIDSILAAGQSLPLSVDYHAAPVIQSSNARIAASFSPEFRSLFQQAWVNLRLFDAGTLSWEEVDRIRESDAGRDYRELIARLTDRVTSDLVEGATQQDIERAFQQEIVHELVEEVIEKRITLGKAVFNLGLNFIPLAGLATTSSDLAAVIEERRSWVALLSLTKS